MNARAPDASAAADARGEVIRRAAAIAATAAADDRMKAFVELWWSSVRCEAGEAMSWAGFYLDQPGEPDATRLVLGHRLPKPACSPIGMHGACGQTLQAARSLVVVDVADLGAGYVACDPRDRSELVVPCLRPDGSAWAVFDVDSHAVGAFSRGDAEFCERCLQAAGLSAAHRHAPAMSR